MQWCEGGKSDRGVREVSVQGIQVQSVQPKLCQNLMCDGAVEGDILTRALPKSSRLPTLPERWPPVRGPIPESARLPVARPASITPVSQASFSKKNAWTSSRTGSGSPCHSAARTPHRQIRPVSCGPAAAQDVAEHLGVPL